MDQGVAAPRADHGAVDRAAGARGCRAPSIAVVGRQRWHQRASRRRVRAAAGTLRRWGRAQTPPGLRLLPTPRPALRLGVLMTSQVLHVALGAVQEKAP